MGQRKVAFAPGEYYHIYNRGTDKRDIYLEPRDYRRFTELLYLCNSTQSLDIRVVRRDSNSVFEHDRGDNVLVAIGAYCLMPNHFHILLTPLTDDGVARFMSKLGTAYSMYFNKKYDRSGSLFQGRFKAKMVIEDEYMKYLYAYIHLNPVKLIKPDWKEKGIGNIHAATEYLKGYKYSSLPKYLDQNSEDNSLLAEEHFPGYFSTAAENMSELTEWLDYGDTSSIAIKKS